MSVFFHSRHHPSNLLGLLLLADESVALGSLALELALASGLGTGTLGVHLLLDGLLASLLGLGTVNVLNEGTLVLEGVTLGEVVKLVVEVLVDLAGSTVLHEETAENPLATHPNNLLGHTGIGGTLALTEATVAANAAGKVELTRAGARVHGDGLLDDEAIGNELADRLARVGVADLGDLIGVEPDLALADAQDGGREPLLGPQVNPERRGKKSAKLQLGKCPIAVIVSLCRF